MSLPLSKMRIYIEHLHALISLKLKSSISACQLCHLVWVHNYILNGCFAGLERVGDECGKMYTPIEIMKRSLGNVDIY